MSMRYRYSKWTAESRTDEQRLQALSQLFSYLLIQTSGEVEDALEILRQIAREHGFFDENLSLEEIINKLVQEGIIEKIEGTLNLTTKGIQQIRKDALRE